MRHILIAVTMCSVASPVFADATIEYGCEVLATGPAGKIEHILPETKVLEPTKSASKFSITLPPGYGEANVQCFRSDVVPAENDWKVVRAGYPLFITERPSGSTISIGLRNGQFEVGFSKSSMPNEDQLTRLQARINELQTSMQNSDFPPSTPK